MTTSVLLIVVLRREQRTLFNQILRGAPYSLIFALDGEDGFDRFVEAKPDLVIAHADAPRLDGTLLCRLIRQQPGGDEVPFVLMAEDADGEARARAAGADAFLPIPFEAGQLERVVEPLLRLGRRRGSVQPPPLDEPAHDTGDLLSSSAESLPPWGEENARGPTSSTALNEAKDAEDPTGESAVVVAYERAPTSVGDDQAATGDHGVPLVAFNPKQKIDDEMPTSLTRAPPELLEALKRRSEGSPSVPVVADVLEEPEVPAGLQLKADQDRRDATDIIDMSNHVRDLEDLRGGIEDSRPPLDPMPLTIDRGASAITASQHGPMIEERISGTRSSDVPRILESEPAPALLEEPPLPLSRSEMRAQVEGTGRTPTHERLIREMPRDATPTGSAPRPVTGAQMKDNRGAASRRARRGLDESQLGKRLAKRVDTLFKQLDELDHYQLLGVEPTSNDRVIRDGYFELSLEFHPDRFFLLRSGDLKEKIYTIYRRVSEAYAVLSDPRRRAIYDDSIGRKNKSSGKRGAAHAPEAAPPVSVAAPVLVPASAPGVLLRPSDVPPMLSLSAPMPAVLAPRLDVAAEGPAAKKFVDLAQTAVENGDYNGARLFLGFALVHEQDSDSIKGAIEEVIRRKRRASIESR